MLIALAFWTLMIACCGYGALFGGSDGRKIAAAYVAAVLLTIAAQRLQQHWNTVNWPVFIVDLALLCALYWIAMRSDRFWPLWLAGFHLITVTAHIAAALAPSVAMRVYFVLSTFWAIPKLLVIVIGVTLDRRAQIYDQDATAPG